MVSSAKSGYTSAEQRPTRIIRVAGKARQIVVRVGRGNARRAAIREQLAGVR